MELTPSSVVFFVAALLLLQIIGFLQTVSAVTSAKNTNATDQVALLSFKSLVDDPLRALASWNDSLPLCRWPGVTCGGRRHPDRVSALDLESLGLTGPISPSLANLTFLRRLHLPANNLQGHIPPELGRMYRLQHLNLSSNSLRGAVPDAVLNVSTLRVVSFRANGLQGELPRRFPPAITDLDLSNNMFTGAVPPSLGNISALAYLDLSNNTLTGTIPSSVGMLSSLAVLDLSRNSLTGGVPPSISNLSLLTKLEAHTNNLSGTLPAELGTALPRLQKLLLYENQFSGPIPVSVSNASGLERVELYYNEFSGTVPWALGTLRSLYSLILGNNLLEAKDVRDWRFFSGLVNCTSLRILDVSNNLLGGSLPDAIANLSAGLTWLGVMGNQISGRIPPEISNLVSLSELRMKQNLLTGTIPTTMGKLQMLQELHLSGNFFSGGIPPELGNLTQLNLLYLNKNQFTGTIPRTLGRCNKLLLLNLGYNKLSGTIPLEIIGISSLSIYLSFSNNELTGPLPPEVGGLINLDALDVSNNKLHGEIPGTLGECKVMEFLFLEGNFFQGTIPPSFSQLKGLQVLDLSRNNLSGQVLEFFVDFDYLDNLNLSFNGFEGEMPKGRALSNSTVVSVLGNRKLCGGAPGLDLPPCAMKPGPRKEHNSSKLVKIVPSVVVAICAISLTCCLIASYRRKKSRGTTSDGMDTTRTSVSYSDIAKATDGFSANNLIGTGSFGSVYRADMRVGKLDVVAVKVISHQQRAAAKTFMTESEALRNVRHRNLVKVLTTCSSVDFRGNDFRALVFEFMPNGSLEKWLHPEEHEGSRRKLSLLQRLNIAIDVASALDYLHHYAGVSIVHCDLKPSNVLLDNDMVARVGDFGLARLIDRDVSEASISSTAGLQGTIGYVPPEYATMNKVSSRGDVYSYGILLLEMFTGKKPTDHAFTEDMSLRKFVDMAFPGRVMDVVDADIFLDDNTRSLRRKRGEIHELLASVLRVGLSCSRELQSERMQMGEVVKELVAAKYAFDWEESQETRKNFEITMEGEGASLAHL